MTYRFRLMGCDGCHQLTHHRMEYAGAGAVLVSCRGDVATPACGHKKIYTAATAWVLRLRWPA